MVDKARSWTSPLRLEPPRCIPVFDRCSAMGDWGDPVEYLFLNDKNLQPGKLEAHVVQRADSLSRVEKDDLVLLNTRKWAEVGETVACIVDGVLRTGNLKITGQGLCLENSQGQIPVGWEQVAGVIVGIEHRGRTAS